MVSKYRAKNVTLRRVYMLQPTSWPPVDFTLSYRSMARNSDIHGEKSGWSLGSVSSPVWILTVGGKKERRGGPC